MRSNSYSLTRIAPTPSGFLHVGNVLSFCITAALADESGARVMLRIDDIDQARADKMYIHDIFDTLHFLDIAWHTGPQNASEFESDYSQVHRLPLYNEAIYQLNNAGLIYACSCSRQQLNSRPCDCKDRNIPLDTANVSWRFDTHTNAPLKIKTYNGNYIYSSLPAGMDNFIVKRRDGLPAYQLTSVVDDLYYGVDLVVRGQDLWPSTLAQRQLAEAWGKQRFSDVAFYHHPLLMDAGKKLSKSAGSTSIRFLRQQGKKPAEIFGMIASMLGIAEPVETCLQLGKAAVKIAAGQ